MDPIKQRIAIAEYLGYIDVREYLVDMDDDCLSLMGRKSQKEPLEFIEYYANDLNAMHEAEKVLGEIYSIESCEYDDWLRSTIGHDEKWRATAAQRAEAFLRTINKWEEDK